MMGRFRILGLEKSLNLNLTKSYKISTKTTWVMALVKSCWRTLEAWSSCQASTFCLRSKYTRMLWRRIRKNFWLILSLQRNSSTLTATTFHNHWKSANLGTKVQAKRLLKIFWNLEERPTKKVIAQWTLWASWLQTIINQTGMMGPLIQRSITNQRSLATETLPSSWVSPRAKAELAWI